MKTDRMKFLAINSEFGRDKALLKERAVEMISKIQN